MPCCTPPRNPARESASVAAPPRHRHQWGVAVGEGTFWLARVENPSRGGGVAGLTPTPYHSGERAWEHGITKSGNRHVRWMTTELAWSWVRYQPENALSGWFRERCGGGGKRLRRIGMVAGARKLLMALWRILETGVFPAGARPQRGVSGITVLSQASALGLVEAAR